MVGGGQAAAAARGSTPVLVVVAGPLRGTRVSLAGELILGRGASAGLDLADAAVSRRHARVSPDRGGWQVADLGSGNGTFLNGHVLAAPMPLLDGDELRLGISRLEYRDEPDEEEAAAEAGAVAGVQGVAGGGGAVAGGARAAAGGQGAAGGAGPAGPAGPVQVEALGVPAVAIPLAGSPATTSIAVAAESELLLLRRRLRLVGEVGELMSRTTEIDELLGAVLRRVMAALPQADRACVALLDEATGELRARVALDRGGAAARMPLSQKLLRSAVERRQAVLVGDAAAERDVAGTTTAGLLGLRSILCLPLVVGSRVFGVLQVDTAIAGQRFDVEDLHALAGVAPSIALAIANAQLHGRLLAHELEMSDLELAQRVQRQFLPQEAPAVPGYRFAFFSRPALAVGGDLFDFLPLESGRLGVALGDVAGKGVSAALLMARVMSDLRFVAGQGLAPGETLARLSRLLAGATREAMFATLLYLELDPAAGDLHLANAGHPLPLLRRAGGAVVPLDLPAGLPAGVRADVAYASRHAALARHEALLLYTDGVTEAVAASGERFGDERLCQALAAAPADADAIVGAIAAAVAHWSRGCPPADDLSLVCLLRD